MTDDTMIYGPFPETIADRVVGFLRRYVSFSDTRQADILALWAIHTWAFDAAYVTPYIYITSAEKQSGKTLTIELLELIVKNGQTAGSVTGPSLFKQIEGDQFDEEWEGKPTLFIDELDTIFTGSSNEMLRSVLNSGYKRNGFALRASGKYSTFCPKLLAGIDNAGVPDTVADRSIRITLKRMRQGETVERMQLRKVEPIAQDLQKDIAAWARDHLQALMADEPPIIEEISPRAFDIAEPLLAIAMQLNPAWTRRAYEAVRFILQPQGKSLSVQAQVLVAAKEFMDIVGTDRIQSAVLADRVGINTKKLGVLLAPYEIRPSTYKFNGVAAKGYTRKDFEDAWDRYL